MGSTKQIFEFYYSNYVLNNYDSNDESVPKKFILHIFLEAI